MRQEEEEILLLEAVPFLQLITYKVKQPHSLFALKFDLLVPRIEVFE